MQQLIVHNSLTRRKEVFEPLNPPYVGMYVCGPTVYGDPHLGHAKSYVSFDVIYRYLRHLGYKVRYVQNITDVGHLTDDADEGEDKIQKQSKVEQLEPMEVVEHYMNSYFREMDALNQKRPSITPRPSGHIPEQVEYIKALIEKGFAYEVDGSVYFDVSEYQNNGPNHYGKLSGKKPDELAEGAANRKLAGQQQKKSPLDFALWKKASPQHLMQWPSPWSDGYPGWHIECTAMSQKYLGSTFDIHGGGMENMFPHHECEIAQAEGAKAGSFARYWFHNNMVTVNGQKMGKSQGNSITLAELFNGTHTLLNRGYDPMTVRFLILQSHYRNPLDFSNEALESAHKGFQRLVDSHHRLHQLTPTADTSSFDVSDWVKRCYSAMNDDFNTPMLIAELFEGSNAINRASQGQEQLNQEDLGTMQTAFHQFVEDILGLDLRESQANEQKLNDLMDLVLELRQEARQNKDFQTADKIRDRLQAAGFAIRDTKNGTEWSLA